MSSNMLYIGDSVGRHINVQQIEMKGDLKINVKRAYSAVFEEKDTEISNKPLFPYQNFSDVVPQELKKANYKYLVLAGLTVDVTNLRTEVPGSKSKFNLMKRKVISSMKTMFKLGINALNQNRNVKYVLITEVSPRISNKASDPNSYKEKLVALCNQTLWELAKKCNRNIKIVKHGFDSDIFKHIKNSDGIHFYGDLGKQKYTDSIVKALLDIGVIKKPAHFYS